MAVKRESCRRNRRAPSTDLGATSFQRQTAGRYEQEKPRTLTKGETEECSEENTIRRNSILLNGGKLQVETLPEWPMSGGRSLKLPPEKYVLMLDDRLAAGILIGLAPES